MFIRCSRGSTASFKKFAQDDRIFDHSFKTQRIHYGYLEPYSSFVVVEPNGRIGCLNLGEYQLPNIKDAPELKTIISSTAHLPSALRC